MRKMLAFAAPMVGLSIFSAAVGVVPGVYAKYYGVTLSSIGTAILLARLFDIISDPLVGYWSDRLRSRSGSRKPLVAFGGGLMVCSCYFLFAPPVDVGVVYFGLCYFLYFFSGTVFIIPKLAWGNEFVTESTEKTQMLSVIAIVKLCGQLLFFLLPMLPFFSTSEMTPELLKTTVLFGAPLLVVGLFCMLKFVPNGRRPINHSQRIPRSQSYNAQIVQILRALWSNKPFIIFVIAQMFFGMAIMFWSGVFFIFVDVYLGLGESYAKMEIIANLCGFAVVPMWYYLSLWLGKRNTWLLASALLVITFFSTGLMRPGETDVLMVSLLRVACNSMMTGVIIVATSMLGDIIDYGNLMEGEERGGTYFSIKAFLFKFQIAIGGGLGLIIVGWFGFDASAVEHTADSAFGFQVVMVILPIIFTLISIVFVLMSPINERRHDVIRRRLDARAKRSARSNSDQESRDSHVVSSTKVEVHIPLR